MEGPLRALKARDIPEARLLEGFSLAPGYLWKSGAWLSWDFYAALMQRYGELVGSDAADLAAEAHLNLSRDSESVRRLCALFADVGWIYWFVHHMLGPMTFAIVENRRFERLAGGGIVLELGLPPNRVDCPLFFEITLCALRRTPQMLGETLAEVEMERGPGSATYSITLPESATAAARLGRVRAHPAVQSILASFVDLVSTVRLRKFADEPEVDGEPHDYRALLRAEFAARHGRNRHYSLRAFARDLGVSPGGLINVIAGRRKLSLETAAQIADSLGYSPEDRQRLFRMVERETVSLGG
jgi:hypothetical protein